MRCLLGDICNDADSCEVYIGVYAYGEQRFNLTFSPCTANIHSLCPLNHSVPIEANGIIPVAPSEVVGIPALALTIPDFEGQAILRLFANSTETEIACYAATLTNGHSFSHPAAIGGTVAVFVSVAFISSVAVAIYGESIQEVRKHYAHSLSMLVTFSVLQHIFFTGALSVNFPSVLASWWSNFAWTSGMIYSRKMQDSISRFAGSNQADISRIGSAESGQDVLGVGGGYQISSIYRRATLDTYYDQFGELVPNTFHKRDLINSTSGFKWYGSLVEPGMPLPGNYSGFAGTLGTLQIPLVNAFMTAFLWFLILIASISGSIILCKATIELLAWRKLLKSNHLNFFRAYWIYFMGILTMRACHIAFFMMVSLAIFQLAFGGSAGAQAIAAITFLLFFLGLFGLSAYAIWSKLGIWPLGIRKILQKTQPDPEKVSETSDSEGALSEETISPSTIRPRSVELFDSQNPHDDVNYMIRFGWLFARYRRSRWWFFSAWLIYEFVRACFYGGAIKNSLAQLIGLLVWETVALVTIIILRPFESNRLNLLMVYALGFSKVICIALCFAFDPRVDVNRVTTTIFGIVIIVTQGILTICLLIAIAVGAISSWMSIKRFHEEFHPKSMTTIRSRYFEHIDQASTDRPTTSTPRKQRCKRDDKLDTMDEVKEPHFAITSVRREVKIEDDEFSDESTTTVNSTHQPSSNTCDQTSSRAVSQTLSLTPRTSASILPHGARGHRKSWSFNDFQNMGQLTEPLPSRFRSKASAYSGREESVQEQDPPLSLRPVSASMFSTEAANEVPEAGA